MKNESKNAYYESIANAMIDEMKEAVQSAEKVEQFLAMNKLITVCTNPTGKRVYGCNTCELTYYADVFEGYVWAGNNFGKGVKVTLPKSVCDVFRKYLSR